MTDKACREALEKWWYSEDRLPLEAKNGGDAPTGFNAGWRARGDYEAARVTPAQPDKAGYSPDMIAAKRAEAFLKEQAQPDKALYAAPHKQQIYAESYAQPDKAECGWIEWKGGKCPVPGGTLVEAKMPDGIANMAAGCFSAEAWEKKISAYRILQPDKAEVGLTSEATEIFDLAEVRWREANSDGLVSILHAVKPSRATERAFLEAGAELLRESRAALPPHRDDSGLVEEMVAALKYYAQPEQNLSTGVLTTFPEYKSPDGGNRARAVLAKHAAQAKAGAQ